MPTSTIVACSRCCNATLFSASLEYASVSQSCSEIYCGSLPCSSTAAVYDDEGNCTSAAVVCSPNWDDLTPAEKCAAQRYLTITTEDLSGSQHHGRTLVQEYTTDEDGNCTLETTCSGSRSEKTVETGTFPTMSGETPACLNEVRSGGSETTRTETITWNNDCTTSTAVECGGYSTSFYSCTSVGGDDTGGGTTCDSSYVKIDGDCQWMGEMPGVDDWGEPVTVPVYENCLNISQLYTSTTFDSTLTITPPNSCKVTNTYTVANEESLCTPKTLPSYPAFNGCENDNLVDPPELAPGQGYNSEAYFYEQPNNPANSSKQSVKYRACFPPPSTCYIKIWFRHRVQKWKYDDCSYTWSTDGSPTYVNAGFFEWTGEFPCLNDLQAPANACVNRVCSPHYTVVAAKNTSVQIEWKANVNVNYPEPAWPQP